MRSVRRLGCSFTWEVRKSLSGKDSREHRLDRFKSVSHEGRLGKHSRPWEPQAEVGGILVHQRSARRPVWVGQSGGGTMGGLGDWGRILA